MGKIGVLNRPVAITEIHHIEDFDCGVTSLNAWLQHRALSNHRKGASKVFVSTDENNHVQGYYALSAGEMRHEALSRKFRQNMPNPIPVVVLGRLAVSQSAQGRQLGRGLLQDAFLRTQQAGEIIGIRALVVHALDDNAKAFYLQYGFVETPMHPLTLIMGL